MAMQNILALAAGVRGSWSHCIHNLGAEGAGWVLVPSMPLLAEQGPWPVDSAAHIQTVLPSSVQSLEAP